MLSLADVSENPREDEVRTKYVFAIMCTMAVILALLPLVVFAGRSAVWSDDFKALDQNKWWVVKGSVQATNGWLVLRSKGGNGGGAEVQSRESFLCKTIEIRASADDWHQDTTIGIERWLSEGHAGIVISGGCLGILDLSKPGENQVYKEIPGFENLKGKPHVFKFIWRKGRVDLFIDGKSAVSYEGKLVPDKALNVRLSASNDYKDTLRIDYVRVR
jgi:hypothetical protein